MSLFHWLFRSMTPVKPQAESSGLSRMEATRPASRGGASMVPPSGNAQAANRKGERMARRELLYTVVRDSMMRAGVLSASYKFKVLSLDARGRQFLVMVDLAQERSGNTTRLAEIEALIAQAAKSRHDILVTRGLLARQRACCGGRPQCPGQAEGEGAAATCGQECSPRV